MGETFAVFDGGLPRALADSEDSLQQYRFNRPEAIVPTQTSLVEGSAIRELAHAGHETPSKKKDVPASSPDKPLGAAVSETVPMVGHDEFASIGKLLVERIGKSEPKAVTREQLAAALQDPSIRGKDAQVLASLYVNFNQLAALGNARNLGLSALDKFDSIQKQDWDSLTDEAWAAGWLNDRMSEGASNSTVFSKADVQRIGSSRSAKIFDKKGSESILKRFAEISASPNGITLADIRAFSERAYHGDQLMIARALAPCVATNLGQVPAASRELYSNKNNPLESIKPEAVWQGSLGDCYFEAPLMAVAAIKPEIIRDSIQDNGNGTYTVTFRGATDEPILVRQPSEAEQGVYNHASRFGTWASVMEKAYGEYCGKHFWRRNISDWFGTATPQGALDGGGLSRPVLELLTGRSTDEKSDGDMKDVLLKAFQSQPPKITVAGSIHGPDGARTSDGILMTHAYAVTRVLPGTGGPDVELRDPGNPSWVTTIPWDKFQRSFLFVTTEH